MFKKMLTKKPVIITLALLLMLTFVFANAPAAFADTFTGSGVEPDSIFTEEDQPQVEASTIHVLNFFSIKGGELYGSVSVADNTAPDVSMIPEITPPEKTELLGWYADGAEEQRSRGAV